MTKLDNMTLDNLHKLRCIFCKKLINYAEDQESTFMMDTLYQSAHFHCLDKFYEHTDEHYRSARAREHRDCKNLTKTTKIPIVWGKYRTVYHPLCTVSCVALREARMRRLND